ncbi:cilia- and flagella-associated protein 251 [Eurytemora carolleeae]|uniref:cilia- and flagella-associated protein 251 n=1 Tax=Eurytemora carolleeae TaxID=1294199 RepID=UPI000C779C9C|nr:cilia- and flagella-associated protein 251 [Eurytemora carolleeae]|eukprot:XP_023319464.1 cilia- and flagella-associated protein 251-like [Eurytemora affinis]
MSDEQEKGTREEQENQEEGTMKDLEEKVDQVDLQAAGGSDETPDDEVEKHEEPASEEKVEEETKEEKEEEKVEEKVEERAEEEKVEEKAEEEKVEEPDKALLKEQFSLFSKFGDKVNKR